MRVTLLSRRHPDPQRATRRCSKRRLRASQRSPRSARRRGTAPPPGCRSLPPPRSHLALAPRLVRRVPPRELRHRSSCAQGRNAARPQALFRGETARMNPPREASTRGAVTGYGLPTHERASGRKACHKPAVATSRVRDSAMAGAPNASMTAWSSRADGQNAAREMRRVGATRYLRTVEPSPGLGVP